MIKDHEKSQVIRDDFPALPERLDNLNLNGISSLSVEEDLFTPGGKRRRGNDGTPKPVQGNKFDWNKVATKQPRKENKGGSGKDPQGSQGSQGPQGGAGKNSTEKNGKSAGQQQKKRRGPKPVVGTGGGENRKMIAPPADIFVYGVHKSTTIGDIVEDLCASGITITEDDIEKKTREDSQHVDCY